MTPQAIEQQVERLHELLYGVEKVDNIITAHEIINVNKHKIFNDSVRLKNVFRRKELKPFVFLNNKN
ncbi:MAG: hypothetical protein ABIR81_08565 [Ginsengibacter sp.]